MLEQELKQFLDDIKSLLTDVDQEIGATAQRGSVPNGSAATTANPDHVGILQDGRYTILPLPSSLSTAGPNSLDHVEERLSIWTERQHSLIWYYETFGVIGLAWKVKEIARSEIWNECRTDPQVPELYRRASIVPAKRGANSPNVEVRSSQEEEEFDCHFDTLTEELEALVNEQGEGHKSWRRIFYDWYRGGQSRMLFYLSSIPEEVMRAVLHGNLPQRMSEPSFFQRFGASVQLSDDPGTYALYVAQRPPPRSPPADRSPALGLTLEEMELLYKTACRYIDLEDNNFVADARLIDSAIGGSRAKLDYSSQRRYGGSDGKDDFTLHARFLKRLKSSLIRWADSLRASGQVNDLKTPLERCFVYVGFANMPLSRCPTHWTHGQTMSPILGMVTAIVRKLWGNRFDAEHHSYQIFRVVDDDELGFVEILTSMVASAYHWDLGLAYTYAGGKKKIPHLEPKFKQNAQRLKDEGIQIQRIRASVEKFVTMKNIMQQDLGEQRRNAMSGKDLLIRNSGVLREVQERTEKQRLALQLQELDEALCGSASSIHTSVV